MTRRYPPGHCFFIKSQNLLPSFFLLSIPHSALWISAISFTIASPRTVMLCVPLNHLADVRLIIYN